MITGTMIADTAQHAMTDPHFTQEAGDCQMFARQVAERVGGVVGQRMDQYRQGTAAQTMAAFRDTSYNIWERSSGKPMPALQEGDYLYKGRETSGVDGHVGCAANGKREGRPPTQVIIYENSHAELPGHYGHKQGAKGWRTLADFGPFDMIVRLV